MPKHCRHCSKRLKNQDAKHCPHCAKSLAPPQSIVKRDAGQPSDVDLEAFDFMADDLINMRTGWNKNREAVRRRDMLWNLIGRDISKHEVHKKVKEMQAELEEMDKGTYLERHHVQRDHYLQRLKNSLRLQRADEDITHAIGMLIGMIEKVDKVIDELPYNEETKEELLSMVLEQIVFERVRQEMGTIPLEDDETFDHRQRRLLVSRLVESLTEE